MHQASAADDNCMVMMMMIIIIIMLRSIETARTHARKLHSAHLLPLSSSCLSSLLISSLPRAQLVQQAFREPAWHKSATDRSSPAPHHALEPLIFFFLSLSLSSFTWPLEGWQHIGCNSGKRNEFRRAMRYHI